MDPEIHTQKENLAIQLRSWVNLLMDRRLPERLGMCKTELRIMFFERIIDPFPATVDYEPSAILTLKFPGHGE